MNRKGIGPQIDWHKDNGAEDHFIVEIDRFLEIDTISATLRAVNDRKVGAPFKVPDAAYDNKDHWNAIRERKIDYIANIHSVLDPKRRNSSSRKHVHRILEVGREKWKEEVGYGERWRIEATFGDLKHRFGDTLRARARKRVSDMIGFLVQVFDRFKSTRMSV